MGLTVFGLKILFNQVFEGWQNEASLLSVSLLAVLIGSALIVFFGFIILLKGILLSDVKKLIKR